MVSLAKMSQRKRLERDETCSLEKLSTYAECYASIIDVDLRRRAEVVLPPFCSIENTKCARWLCATIREYVETTGVYLPGYLCSRELPGNPLIILSILYSLSTYTLPVRPPTG